MGNQYPHGAKPEREISEVYNLCSQHIKKQSQLSVYESQLSRQASKEILGQLFESFSRYPQYSWAEEILPLFKMFFVKDFPVLWEDDKEKFY